MRELNCFVVKDSNIVKAKLVELQYYFYKKNVLLMYLRIHVVVQLHARKID